MKKFKNILLVATIILVAGLFMGKVKAFNGGIYVAHTTKDITKSIEVWKDGTGSFDTCAYIKTLDSGATCSDELATITSTYGSTDTQISNGISTEVAKASAGTLYYLEEVWTPSSITTIPAGVTVVAQGYNNTSTGLMIMGTLKTGSVHAGGVTGTGNIILDYGVNIPMGSPEPSNYDVYRLSAKTILGVKVDILKTTFESMTDDKTLAASGAALGFIESFATGSTDPMSLQQKNMVLGWYNAILSSNLSDYELVLKSMTDNGQTIYYGAFQKKATTTTKAAAATTTKKVTNPKTGDTIAIIASLMLIVGAGSFVTLRKIRKAN